MGLRCLLGHDFTEPRTERDREERGDEVIITVRDVKECRRCGDTRVVSENKEVTSVGQLLDESGAGAAPRSGPAAGDGPAEPGAADAEGGPAGGTAADAGIVDDAAITDAEPGESLGDPDDGFAHPAAGEADLGADVEEDAEIIDGGPAREPGGDGPTAGDEAAGPVDADADADAAGTVDAPADADADADAAAGSTGGSVSPAGTGNAGSDGRARGEWPDEDAHRRGDDRAGDAPAEWPDPGRGAEGEAEAADAGAHSPADGESEDVEILGDDADGTEGAAASEARRDVVPDAEAPDGPGAAAPAGDDAEFVGGGPDTGGDGSAVDGSAAGGDWPAQTGEDEGFDAEAGGDAGDVSVDGNLTPRVDGEVPDDGDAEFIEADPDASARGGSAGGAGDAGGSREPESGGPSVELTTTSDRAETVYVCPDCGAREPVGASSARAGDICRECRRGYIEERALE